MLVPAGKCGLLNHGSHKTKEEYSVDKPSEKTNGDGTARTCVIQCLADGDNEGEQHQKADDCKYRPPNRLENSEHAQDADRGRESGRPQYLAKIGLSDGSGQKMCTNEQRQQDPYQPADHCNSEHTQETAGVCGSNSYGRRQTGKDNHRYGLTVGCVIGFNLLVGPGLKPGSANHPCGKTLHVSTFQAPDSHQAYLARSL